MKRVLVIDDEEAVRKLIRKALPASLCKVTDAPEARSALDLHAKKPFDLIILDVFMPGMDGLEAIQEVRASGDTVPILVISGGRPGSNVDGLFLADTLGATRTLPKPFEVKQLVAIVKELLKA